MHAAGVHGLTVFVFTPARLDALAAGAFLAALARGPRGFEPLVRWKAPLAIGSSAIIIGIFLIRGHLLPSDTIVEVLGLPSLAILSSTLVVELVTRPRGRVSRFCNQRALLFLGKYSYGTYIVHFPMVLALHGAGITFERLCARTGSQIAAQIVFFLILGSGSVALSVLSWNLLEKRIVRLKDRYFPIEHPERPEGPARDAAA
jgi:peptidoglycan/LPS O-acetylase OafA/YrhL